MSPRPSILWAPETRTAMRTCGVSGAQLIRDALDQVVADPVAAVVSAGPHMAVPSGSVAKVPVDGDDARVRFDAARAALDAAFGGVIPVGAVVRGLVVQRLLAG